MRAALAVAAALGSATAHELVVGLKHRNVDKLDQTFWSVSDPKSGEYLRHRSLSELAELIGAPASDVEAVKQWLRDQGARPDSIKVSALRDTVTATIPDDATVSLAVSQSPVPTDFIMRRGGEAPSMPHARKARAAQFGPSIKQQKKAYGIPVDLQASNPATLQMVWGPGTFGYSPSSLAFWKEEQCPLLNTSKVHFDTKNHGQSGGDNFGEGQLDTKMITSFGLNVETLVSNTNTSSSTEEGNGFGQAFLDFLNELASRETIPQVMSLSLGSLSPASCDLLCNEAVKMGHKLADCQSYMQQQRQVCMYLSEDQGARIDQALQVLGTRGMSIFGASGDGGSHFSFGKFSGGGSLSTDLNTISCKFQIPVYPTGSPYITSVGGTSWEGGNSDKPEGWSRAGGGFSWQYPMPAHQKQAVAGYLKTSGVPPTSSFNASGRAYPDIACISSDGTSQSSPSMAGIFSMITDHRLNNGLKPLGYLGPRLWQMMEKYPGEAFEDVTTGNTKTSCDNGFPATKGWDPASGWGRPKWDGLLKHFGADSTL